jgi:tetratricopeptide (TPR) repeat protein
VEVQTLAYFESCGDHVMDPRQDAVREAHLAARTALGSMMAADGPSGSSAVPFSGGVATASPSSTRSQSDRALDGWNAAEALLQAVTNRPDLNGQSVIAEARRQQRLSLTDAHALAALHSWVERAGSISAVTGVTVDTERTIARESMAALDNALSAIGTSTADVPPAPGASAYIDSVTALGASRTADERSRTDEFARASALSPEEPRVTVSKSWLNFDSRFVMGGVALILVALLAVAGYMAFARQDSSSMYEDAVAAYQRGSYDLASTAFARIAQDNPDDVRPLIFLGRIAREQNDFARSRRFLEAAVRKESSSALAQRELAGTLLADGQPELARRFYVRAVELDPTDRVAQGFLGCALHRLARYEEARRWFDRAGQGDWLQCITPIPPPYPGQYPSQPAPYPVPPPR